MVSLRRRRLLGYSFVKNLFAVDLPKHNEDEKMVENSTLHVKSSSVHPLPPIKLDTQMPESNSESVPESSNAATSDSPKEELNHYYPGKEIKRRKRHRRKHYDDHEPCIMRGVYFKNMKWQAAIKVDKKQIHLGTVGSQEEAARLYDRAAFMCGREPNFELSEEEKEELRSYKWEDFLAMTRSAINNKKHQRKPGVGGRRKKSENQLQSEGETEKEMANSSASGDGDVDAFAS
ncbi:ethylene-responsive transcription factor-like protein At4g13040 isoform X2 [Ananas comosus]|uniref:Ethylene-responsive transcription factor-like protein At4g13040 isoform X2 n=1 Tax=Ananas comosus TaxID=4615 RepID=A0A6P5GVW9_ANACO|nr:ethylene-responsive transcription factor-like protein At4g13040 isoform X2 [Ananas comosus]